MKVEMMDEIESAVVEVVDKNNGKLWPGDVMAKLVAKGWNPDEVVKTINTLVMRGILTHKVDQSLHFSWPNEDENIPEVPLLGQLQQALSPSKHDPVNSPSHYTRGGIEAIDFIEAKGLGFCLGNVVKYVSRAGFKADAKLQDLEKARWYLNREIERIKNEKV